MFPLWDIPPWVAFFSSLKPVFVGFGTVMVWVLVIAAILTQLGVIAFGVMTINEAIQKSE